MAVKIHHRQLTRLMQCAYSAEKAAAFAYQGHAGSVKEPEKKAAIHQIELDEWHHREVVLQIMQQYDVPVSKWQELRFHVIGKTISAACYVIGRFMPFYFAGRLESGNVCEYFRMKQFFNDMGITEHDAALYDMGIKEKEHEVYFYEQVKDDKWLPLFEKVFSWGDRSFNNIDMNDPAPLEKSGHYCKIGAEAAKPEDATKAEAATAEPATMPPQDASPRK